MPVELLVGVLFLLSVVANAALLLWVGKADHVTLHWSRPVQSALQAVRARRAGDSRPVRRRPAYVAGRGGPSRETPMSGGAAPGQRFPMEVGRSDASVRVPVSQPPRSAALPPELAELLWRPAAVAPKGDPLESGSNSRAGSEHSPAEEPRAEGPNVLARVVDSGHISGASPIGLDPLTGLEGPASWSRIVEIENARLLRYRRPVTVVMAEVEGLRRLTERLGDEPVDRLLPVIADTFRREARSSDWVARIGAGRFAAFLPETDEIQAINYVERIRVFCEPWLASSAVPLRLAIGWSSPGASTDLEHAIVQAEARMHDDRGTPAKPFQPPHAGPARVVSLSAGSPATEGLAHLTETGVAPAETGRSAQRDSESAAAFDGGVGPGVETA